MFATLDYREGSFNFAVKSWSDFGPHLSLAQSLAIGGNYPTEHPFFPGEFVRYHFLFWFLTANLSYLGLNLVLAANILSIISFLALIILLTTFAETLFRSRAVGRITALLFFFQSSSLSYIPFLWSQESVSGAIRAIAGRTDFLKSGFEYRGDDWGSLTVAVFANQRQLFGAIGVVLIVLISLIEFYRSKQVLEGNFKPSPDSAAIYSPEPSRTNFEWIGTLAFCGLLIGSLPYWNSAIFVAASVVIGSLFILFKQRGYILVCITVIFLVGLPQVLLLRSGNTPSSLTSIFEWGYLVSEPTVLKVLIYVLWTFGIKLVLIILAFVLVPAGYRKLMLAISSPAIVVFLLKLSTDIFNNHKLLNFWNVVVAVFVAYALWYIGKTSKWKAAVAGGVAALTFFGAFIDLFPVKNDTFVKVPFENDQLSDWLIRSTRPSDIFLSDTLISHPILFTGRRVFLGNTLFAWTSGYNVGEREQIHRKMLLTQDYDELLQLLRTNRIAYAAFDDNLRTNAMYKGNNEDLFRKNFETVFVDNDRKYANLKIYRISKGAK